MAKAVPAYVIDTSVALKWFVERGEANVIQARSLREAFLRQDCRLSAPNLLFIEFANALAAGRGHEIAQVQKALQDLRDIEIKVIPFDWKILDRAADLAVLKRVTVYDAYFLVAAAETGAVLVTADDAFLDRLGPNPGAVALRQLRLAD